MVDLRVVRCAPQGERPAMLISIESGEEAAQKAIGATLTFEKRCGWGGPGSPA